MPQSIWIGFDSREADAFAVARHSANRLNVIPVPLYPLILDDLTKSGFYQRPMEIKDGKMWDPISEFWMSTEFANSRFLVPELARLKFRGKLGVGWALFVDCDVLFRVNPQRIFDLADPKYAVMCVKHQYAPVNETKMDGQVQTVYPRKNWSSVMLINCDHPSNAALWRANLVNTLPGRDLHRFCWLEDEEIGELPIEWNYLVGHYTKEDCPSPCLLHFTEGIPRMEKYRDCEYADEWRDELTLWALNHR
jgi:hypothetical protein